MKPEDLYERQLRDGKLVDFISFPFLRKVLKKFDLTREDLAIKLIDSPGNNFLDIGCGSGLLAFKIKNNFNYIYGIDITTSQIQIAEEKAKKELKNNFIFSICNVDEGINFEDEMFDTVTCLAVLEHVFDPYFVVDEISRILKPGGIFILDVPNIAYLKQRINLLFGRLPVTSSPFNWREIGWDGGHLHYFTQKTICKLLNDSGFNIVKITGCGLLAQFRNFYPSLLTGDICIKAIKK